MRTSWRITLFFLITYAFTWFGNLGKILWPSDWWPAPMNPFGPLMAAPLVIVWTSGKAGLKLWWRRVTRFRAGYQIYLAASLVPAVIICASVALALMFGLIVPKFECSILENVSLTLIFAVLFEPLNGPIPEETSFRGFAQDELQQTISPLAASLWVGLGVLVWHLPVLVSHRIPWPIAIALPAVSVVYGWLYQTGKSVWPLVLLHTIQNIVGAILFGSFFTAAENTIWISFLAGFYVVWAVVLFWLTGTSLESKSLMKTAQTFQDT